MSTRDGETTVGSATVNLQDLATHWLACKNAEMARPSPASDDARRSDLLAIGRRLARETGRSGLDTGVEARRSCLIQLGPQDLSADALSAAIGAYASDHAPSSVRRVVSTWRGFCRWLRREGWLQTDPAEELEVPVRVTWKPQSLDLNELGRIVGAVVAPDGRRRSWPERDWALLAAFVGAGIRVGEAITLRVNDLRPVDGAGRLRVLFGVRGRRRDIPVGPEVVAAVDTYLLSRRSRCGAFHGTDPLFVQTDGRPFTRGTLDYLVSTWFRRAGVTSPRGSLAHALRHTYAALLIASGASLPDVQRLLGHRDLSTTQAYVSVVGNRLEETALANPVRALPSGHKGTPGRTLWSCPLKTLSEPVPASLIAGSE